MIRRSMLGAAAMAAGAVGGAVLGYLAERTVVDPAPVDGSTPVGPIPTAVDVPSVDGTRLAALVSGPPDAPTIVLVHGLALSQEIWTPQRRGLERTFRVITFDLRGHGDSDDAVSDDYDVDRLGEDVTAVIDALAGTRVVLVGHSMGGMATLAGLGARPELAGDRIAGVALLNTAASAVLSGLGGGTLAAGIAFMGEHVRNSPLGRVVYGERDPDGTRGNDLATLMTRLLGVGHGGSDQAVDVVRRLVLDSRPHVTGAMWRTAGSVDLHDAVRRTTIPALVIAGQRDRVLPVHHSRRLARELPDARLVELPDVGHVSMLERPDQVLGLLDRFARRALGSHTGHGAA